MSEKFPHNLEKAQEEALKMQANNKNVEAEAENETKKDIILTPDEIKLKRSYISEIKRAVKEGNIQPESLQKIIKSLFNDIKSTLFSLEQNESMDIPAKHHEIRDLLKLEFELGFPMPQEEFNSRIKSLILRYSNISGGRYLNLTEMLPETRSSYSNPDPDAPIGFDINYCKMRSGHYADVFDAFNPNELEKIIEKFHDKIAYNCLMDIRGRRLHEYLNDNSETKDVNEGGKPRIISFIQGRKERLLNEGFLKEVFTKSKLENIVLVKKMLELPDNFLTKNIELLDAVRGGFISRIKDESQHFRYYTYWGNIMRTKEALHIPAEVFSEIALEAVTIYLDKGDFKSVAGIKADTEISPMLIQKYFEEKISQNDWKSVFILNQYFTECQPLYQANLADLKRIASDTNLKFQERQKAIDSLAALSQNGDFGVCQEFSMIIENRSRQQDAPESKWGLDSIQEASFYTLIRLDNSESNDALFKLLFNEHVNSTVKYAVLKKLSAEKRNFLNDDARNNLRSWLQARRLKENKLDWRDMEFINEILRIPSTETRGSSLQLLRPLESQKYYYDEEKNDSGVYDKYAGKSVYEFWQNYKDIPQNTFLQLVQFVDGDENLLNKFQILYALNKKEATKKDNLLYGIVNIQYCSHEIQNLVINKLKEIDFGAKEDINKFSELFRQIVFLDKIDKIKESGDDDNNYEDDNYAAQADNQELSQEIIEIFSKKVGDLDGLTSLLKEAATKKIQEVLPNENITGEKIEAIEKEWGNLEPIFTYLGRYPQLKEYIAEMAANFDSQENWKNWRYSLKNKSVKNQIGHLSSEQLEIWEEDYFSEIGDIMIAESGSDKPRQIQNILQDAIMTHRHIFNPKMGQNKFEYVQKTLENTYSKINESPDKKEIILEEKVKEITADTKSIDAVINFNNLPRIKQSLESIIPENVEIQINKKTKDTINFLMAYLPKELSKSLDENYKQFGDETKIKSEELITPEIRNAVNEKIKEIEASHTKVLDSDIWERLSLDKNNLKNAGQFYQKRQELKAMIDLLRLNKLSNKLIATNKIVEKEGKKGGETIIGVIDNLKKFFKDNPLLLDLKNIEFALKEKIDFGEKRRLAMMFTDNPQMLWQAGKYPLGNGSCQHYAEGGYANQLMGYVGDANCKVAYLVDLNKLSSDIKQRLEEKGFEEIKDNIPAQELLNASLARSIVKMTKDKDNKPVILLEPTYTVVYKGDASMDKYYNIFIDLIVADPMKAKMARGEGKESVNKGSSRSPEGQYEDLSLSNVKFIHKLSKPTKEDMEIIEKIRSSR